MKKPSKKPTPPEKVSADEYPFEMVMVGFNGSVSVGYCNTAEQEHVDIPTSTAAQLQEWWKKQPIYRDPFPKRKRK